MYHRTFSMLMIGLGAAVLPALVVGCQNEPEENSNNSSMSATTQPYQPVNVNDPSDVRFPSLGGGGGHGR